VEPTACEGRRQCGASTQSASALWPCHAPNNPRFDTRRPRRVHGARTRHVWRRHAAAPDRWGVVESGYLAAPRARSSTGNVSPPEGRNQGVYRIVTLVAKCISEPFKIITTGLQVSWMANALLEALSGIADGAQGSWAGLGNRYTYRKSTASEDLSELITRSSFARRTL
jgi:hypothetical protein